METLQVLEVNSLSAAVQKELSRKSVLFISGHDFRSDRKANIHFFARASLSLFKQVRFFSIGYSVLSLFTRDPRKRLFSKGNRWQSEGGVECYLWRTPFHPVRSVGKLSEWLAKFLYRYYADLRSVELDRCVIGSDVIVLESGLSPIFIARISRLNPSAELIYAASDLLSTIGVHDVVQRELMKNISKFSKVRIPARAMASEFSAVEDRVIFLPQGLDKAAGADRPSPYTAPLNAVSVGSMLFDDEFVNIVAQKCPEVTFHIIGAGNEYHFPSNVVQYGEMKFEDTIPFIRHATIGLAPYKNGNSTKYLADSSMKLRQYGAFGLPSVCPYYAVGDYAGRYGYDPSNLDSAIAAVRAALSDMRDWEPHVVDDWQSLAGKLFAPAVPTSI